MIYLIFPTLSCYTSLFDAHTSHHPLILFFLQSYDHHRHLHSFPTRRSSDLWIAYALLEAGRLWGEERYTALRSEEHKSELQSLRHLVCRLLLEKKKQKKRQAVRVNIANKAQHRSPCRI